MKKYAPCSNTDKAVDKEKRKDLTRLDNISDMVYNILILRGHYI